MDTLVPTCASSGVILNPTASSKNACKNWTFTWNNYPSDWECAIELLFYKSLVVVCQEEIGELTKTPHLQGFVMLKKKCRFENIGLPKGVHWEKMRGKKDDNLNYCLKSTTRKPDGKQIIYPVPPKPVKIITNLKPWQKEIEDLYFTEPLDRKVYWFWEPIGGIGKSSFVKYMVVKHGCLFCDGGKKADIMNLVFNTNMDKCKCIIWDLSRSKKGNISYDTVEKIKNGLICNTKFETGFKAFNPPHVFIFANHPPAKPEEISTDKWIIKELKD